MRQSINGLKMGCSWQLVAITAIFEAHFFWIYIMHEDSDDDSL
jgi:hypothetical protein